ncbi:MAG: Mov34/MPN/PAD-1 family protein [Promethearchaeota archaeon]
MRKNGKIRMRVDSRLVDEMRRCAEAASPHESCALIFGEKTAETNPGGDTTVVYLARRVDCIPSSRPSPVSFVIEDVETFYEHWTSAAREGLKLVGVFHSHPAPAFPSGVDVDNMVKMHDGDFKHSIWVILGSRGKMNAFIYFQGKVQRVVLEVEK